MKKPTGYIPGRKALFRRDQMRRLIDPASIAVVGASETPDSFGQRILANIRIGYAGKVYPINPKYDIIAGLQCHASLEDLPKVPDCVIVVVPMQQVLPLAERAAAMGVGGMIVFSAGFAEVGDPALVRQQQRLAEIARESGMRIVGPNCVGIVNLNSMAGLTFMPKFNEMRHVKGNIGLISQSGALGFCILQAMERGIGFSHYLSPGNSCDVDVCDMINYLVDDENTQVIACMFEGIRDGARLLEAAGRALQVGKPLLIYKMANSEISQRTALSHTGTMAGSAAAYQAAFARTGVVVIDSWEDMLETAVLFSKAGRPSAGGVGVMASSGGAAVMAADKAEETGLPLPPPAPQTSALMARAVPDFGSIANPCDMTAESLKSVEMYGDCIRAFAADPNFAAVVVPMMSAYRPTTVERAEYLSHLADTLDKPICLVWINEWLNGPGSEVYDASPRISMFRSMSRCITALKHWLDYYERRDRVLWRLAATRPVSVAGTDAARALLAQAGKACTLSESQSKRILAAYGVATTREILADSPDAALRAAREIGFPVVLKIDSSDIPHKTEAGVVRLNLGDEAAVAQAAAELLDIAGALPGKPAINGILVQQMAAKGVEMMIGARADAQFGPLVLCGFGGIDVELTRDVAVALAPVDREQAREMILSLKKAPLLTGFRNMPALALDDLAAAVSRISEMAADLQDAVAEIDVNPFILGKQDGIAVDALIVRSSGSRES